MKYLFSFLLLALLIFSTMAEAADLTVTILTPTVRQGQTVIAAFDQQPQQLIFDNKPVTPFPFRNGFRVVIPTSRTEKLGTHSICATFPSSAASTCGSAIITPAFVKTIVLPVPKKLNQTPQQVVQNLAASNAAVKGALNVITPKTYIASSFGLPLLDNRKVSSPFGEIRQTGDPSTGSGQVEKITHYGTDFVMSKGSAVAAINSGVISQAYLDPIYGNTIILDHGRGIFSVYMHLDKIKVKNEQSIKKGQIIGTLGETGLASGPHLHLSIKVNGISVDPIQFVNSFK